MRRFFRWLALIGLSLLATAAHAAGVALVIGNANYAAQDVLRNPVHDARLVGEALGKIGFQVVEVANADQITLLAALSKFRERAAVADVAVIYFSGHGMKHAGEQQNYLLPVDMPNLAANAALNPALMLQSKAIAESVLLDAMAGAKYQLLILDACRDNATGTKSGSKGLTRRAGVGSGRLIAYATEENNVARDGSERNSPYAQSLARHITAANVSIVQALDAVADDVKTNTKGAQSPTKTGDLAWNIGFSGGVVSGSNPRPADTGRAAAADAIAWQAAQTINTSEAYRSFLAAHPQSVYVPAANMAIAVMTPGAASLPVSIKQPTVGVSEVGRVRLLGSFNFQGPLGRSDRTLLAFDEKDDKLGVVGAAHGPRAQSPIEVRNVADMKLPAFRAMAGSMFWEWRAALINRGKALRTMSDAWGTVNEYAISGATDEANIVPAKRLEPRLPSNGAAALNAMGDTVIVNLPCNKVASTTAVQAGEMANTAGRWSVESGRCVSTVRLMVDQPGNPVIQYVATDSTAQWITYRYRYGSGDLFVQPVMARNSTDVKRIAKAEAPRDSSDRSEFESAAISPGGRWVASWTRYGPRTAVQGVVPVFATQGERKLQLVVPGRRVHQVLFASDDHVIVLSDSGEKAAPLHVGLYEVASARMLDRLLIDGVVSVHGAAVSASGKRLALALLAAEESKLVFVPVFELR